MPQYIAFGPITQEVVPVCSDGTGPIEEGRPYLELEAANAKEALKIARQDYQFRHVGDYVADDGGPPWKYIRVIRNPGLPAHTCVYEEDDFLDKITEKQIVCEVCEAWADKIEQSIDKLDRLVGKRYGMV